MKTISGIMDINYQPIDSLGRDIRLNDWIADSNGKAKDGPIVYIKDYEGPLSYLFKNGAKIVYWPSRTIPGKLAGMTVSNDDYYKVIRLK